METSKDLRAMFGRHMQAFLREANVLDDLEKTKSALRTIFPGDEHTASGPGALIADQWETLLPRLLIFCDSEDKKKAADGGSLAAAQGADCRVIKSTQ